MEHILAQLQKPVTRWD